MAAYRGSGRPTPSQSPLGTLPNIERPATKVLRGADEQTVFDAVRPAWPTEQRVRQSGQT